LCGSLFDGLSTAKRSGGHVVGRSCLQTYPEDLDGEKSGRRRSSKFAAKSLQLPKIYLGM